MRSGRAALDSREFRYINMNGNNSAPKFEMLAEFSTSCTAARCNATAMTASVPINDRDTPHATKSVVSRHSGP